MATAQQRLCLCKFSQCEANVDKPGSFFSFGATWLDRAAATRWLQDLDYKRSRDGDGEEMVSILDRRTGGARTAFRIARHHFDPAFIKQGTKRATLLKCHPVTGDPARPNFPLRNFGELSLGDLRRGQQAQAPAPAVRAAPRTACTTQL